MSVRMRALRGFIGRSGEGVGRDGVKAGEEFNAASDRRADELENRPKPLAIRLDSTPKQRKLAVPPKNEASETGPLSTTGGETGGEQPSSSYPAARAPETRPPDRQSAVEGKRS